MSDMYQEQILEEAQSPQCFGEIEGAEKTVQGTNASCGDHVKIFLNFATPNDPTSPIVDISWTGQGCVISQAAMSVLAGKIKSEKLTLEQVTQLREQDLEELLGLSEISIGRIKCLLLGLRTLQT
jgi:nitrogen fixation NifU-like protein